MKTQLPHDPVSGRLYKRQANAFSLVEMLVTIAVIAILAMIIVPVVDSARTNAHQAENVSKLRVLGLASLSYAAENGGKLPVVSRLGVKEEPRMTQSPVLYSTQTGNMLSMMSKMWDPNTNGSSVWGLTDYLAGPQSFYGPFTPFIERAENGFSFYRGSTSAFLISYVYYSLPYTDTSSPPRNRVHPLLVNEDIGTDSLPSTPLVSDITTENWSELVGGYTGKYVHCVHLDGSVSAHDKNYIFSLASNDKIRALGGLLKDERAN